MPTDAPHAQSLALTRREAQVLALVARGWTNGRIAHALTISERTVRKHLENVNDKLGTVNRASAVSRWRGGVDASARQAGQTHRGVTPGLIG